MSLKSIVFNLNLKTENTNAIKNIIETSSLPITIMIAGMDNSLFVPYKQYIFSFFRERRDCNGVYILTEKQEVYIAQGEGQFYSSMILKFEKKH